VRRESDEHGIFSGTFSALSFELGEEDITIKK
jgi:hypothetical protein